jgi:hypothetical protein
MHTASGVRVSDLPMHYVYVIIVYRLWRGRGRIFSGEAEEADETRH